MTFLIFVYKFIKYAEKNIRTSDAKRRGSPNYSLSKTVDSLQTATSKKVRLKKFKRRLIQHYVIRAETQKTQDWLIRQKLENDKRLKTRVRNCAIMC